MVRGLRQIRPLTEIAKSEELGDLLDGLAEPVYEQAASDPNEFFRATLRKRRFVTRGRQGRVSVQIGVEPIIGARVEAKRGTLARALSQNGF